MLSLALCISIAVVVVLPIVLALLLCRKKKKLWKPLLAGALCFTVFQILLRMPLLEYVIQKQSWYIIMSVTQPYLNVIFLSLSAALFEEIGRFLVMRYFLKTQRSCGDAITFGLGHGGIEAIALTGSSLIFYLIVQLRAPASLLGSILPASVLAGGVERLLTIVIHIGLSVMVMKSVRERAPWYLILAIFIHTTLNFGAVFLMPYFKFNMWMTEGFILLFAVAMAVFTVMQYKKQAVPK